MIRPGRATTIAATAVAMVALAVAAITIFRASGPGHVVAAPRFDPSRVESPVGDALLNADGLPLDPRYSLSFSTSSTSEFISRFRDAAGHASLDPTAASLPDSFLQDFAALSTSVLALQTATTPDEYHAARSATGLAENTIARTNPNLEESLRENADFVARIHFDPDAVRVRPLHQGGRAFDYPPTPERPARMKTSPPESASGFAKVSEQQRREYEIIVPAIFRALDGTPFKGELGIGMGWDPSQGRWVPTRSTIYGAMNLPMRNLMF